MKTIFRFFVTTIGLVLIVMAIGAILFSTQAGAVADAAFERMLGYIYQTNVTIDHVTFLPRERAMLVQGNEVVAISGQVIVLAKAPLVVSQTMLFTRP